MDHKSLPNSDELVSTLKRTNLPTIVIEGKDDVFIYRWIKQQLSTSPVSILTCGGRNTLFKIYDRRSEFSDKNVVFVADQDSYIFEGVNQDRNDIIFTSGYCIENDIYSGSGIRSFLDTEDCNGYELLKNIVCAWFAFEVETYLDKKQNGLDAPLQVGTHINRICPPGHSSICPTYSHEINYTNPKPEIFTMILENYGIKLRGKQLFQMLSRFMSKKDRFSQFSDKNLIEIALKQGGNPYINLLAESIDSKLNF
ncbi:DUF4435 domain-containing protein [Nitrincola sp. MINF-07-Sa-05]|uniref:DUF4435 domain-containing protein n=1 Tax=Nitrincola salilacus TaxID=3400273 RepID=UPI0039181159